MEWQLGGRAAKAEGQGFLRSEFHISADWLFHDELSLLLSTTGSITCTWPGPEQSNQFSFIAPVALTYSLWSGGFTRKAGEGNKAERRRRHFLLPGSYRPTLTSVSDSCFEVQATLKLYIGFKAAQEGEDKNGQLLLLIQSAFNLVL